MLSSSETTDSMIHYRFDNHTLYLTENLTLHAIDNNGRKLVQELKSYSGDNLVIDLSQLQYLDTAGVTFLNVVRKILSKRGISVKIINASDNVDKIIQTFSAPAREESDKTQTPAFIEEIGAHTYRLFKHIMRDYLYLMADLFYWSVVDLFHRKGAHRKGEFINQSVQIGVNAVPIIGLISLLIGLVLALQSAAQLRQFGANIFMVDLIVIAMTREMGPLLTAIMIAGRSGSAITSEVATMVVTEEIDALKSMALNPMRYVIVPKMHASIFTMPFLTIMADLFGIVGGMIISYFYLDLSAIVFYNRMTEVLYIKDMLTGILKSLVFATLIVQTGSYYGFHVQGGSEAVGRYTTASVVTSIFLVILADSIIGLIFY